MVFEEKTVSSDVVFEGKVIRVRVDKIKLPDEKLAEREIVEHPGGVGIVAITDNNEIILVKQFRKPIEKAIYEIPAGKLDSGEAHRLCGIRELKEETGMTAEKFEYLGYMYPSPGFINEVTHIYFAEGLSQGDTDPDEDEFLDIVRVPLDEAYEMALNGELHDAKTVFGILKYVALKDKENDSERGH